MNDRYLFKAKDCNFVWRIGLLVRLQGARCAIEEVDGTGWACDSETLCRCTGLKDKNGTLIWENDIVATPYIDPIFGDMVNDKILEDYTWKVLFIDGTFCVDNGYTKIYLNSFCKNGCIKVLSNIFDNPELLEVE